MIVTLDGLNKIFNALRFLCIRGCIILVLSIADDLRNDQRVISSKDLEETMSIYGKNNKLS